MKKNLLILMFVCLVTLTGCQNKEENITPDKNQETAVEENSAEKEAALEEVLGDYFIEPSDALKSVFSKSWNVTGTEDVYVLETDGTGLKNEEAFTYECGFDEENNIILKFMMADDEEGISYIAASDATGYGLDLVPVEKGVAMNFFPSNMSLLAVSDEKAAGLTGIWQDDNKNEYVFEEDGSLLIKGKEAETPGTWCAVEKDGSVLLVNLMVEGGSLEFEYELQEEGKTLALYNRSAETWYYWYKS